MTYWYSSTRFWGVRRGPTVRDTITVTLTPARPANRMACASEPQADYAACGALGINYSRSVDRPPRSEDLMADQVMGALQTAQRWG